MVHIEKFADVVMPGIDVDGECVGTLVPALVDVAGSRVVCMHNRSNAVRLAIGAGDIGAMNVIVSNEDVTEKK